MKMLHRTRSMILNGLLAAALAMPLYAAAEQNAEFQQTRILAEQGDAAAQFNLGLIYTEGQGVAKNDKLAVQWFRKAAEQGEVYAQFNLGVMYAQGRGVAKNDELAVDWFRKAAEQGHQGAIEVLKQLNGG